MAALAARALGERALAVTAVSPALATGELEGASAVARAVGIAHETTRRTSSRAPATGATTATAATTEVRAVRRAGRGRQARGFAAVLSGANADDTGDWRPGLVAAEEHGVVHPLLEAGATKADVRALARALGVPSADKPASPCLASRIPYGTPVDPDTLRRSTRPSRRCAPSATACCGCATTGSGVALARGD